MTAIKECLCFVSISDYVLAIYANAAHVPYISIERFMFPQRASYSHTELKWSVAGALGEAPRLVPEKA